MIETAPLLVNSKLSNFVFTTFASWTEIADLLEIGEQLNLKDRTFTPEELVETASEEAAQWSLQYTRVNGRSPTEEAVLERENEIVDLIKYYYTPERVVSEQLDVELLVKDINEWSSRGPDRPHLFGNVPSSGICLEYFKTEEGIQFTVYNPFLIPYTELFYDRETKLPDWGLVELQPLEVVETLTQLQCKLGKRLVFKVDADDVDQPWKEEFHGVY